MSAEPADVVKFWREAGPDAWFRKDADFDDVLRDRFLDSHMAAARRELDACMADADGALALVLLLDQIPRNIFRGTAHQFATDPLARHVAGNAILAGFDAQYEPRLRSFFFLPFEHSEDPADQARSLALFTQLGDAELLKWAQVHADIINRFGRFPHRNPLLGRADTAEERDFLAAGGFAG